MKKFVNILVLVAVFVCMLPINAAAANTGKWPKSKSAGSISAESAIVMELNTGTILYEKNIHKKQYPASITKIMTTLLCLENAPLTDTVTFSHTAVTSIEPGSSHLAVVTDEQIKMEDCLYGIMLMSANEICNGVAEHVAGSIGGFVDMMNEKAKELGCQGTHFANPNGLFLSDHYTTAYDMALIASAAMKNPEFRKITGSKTYVIPKTNKNSERYLYNKHNMLHPISYPYGYDGCIGGKTGYTDLARYTLVTFAKRGDMELVSVIMRTNNSPKVEPNEYTDSTKILDFAFDNYKYYPLENKINDKDNEKSYSIFSEYSPLFDDENAPIYITENAGIVLPKGVKLSKAEKKTTMFDNIEIKEGENVIGQIEYLYGGKVAGKVDIIYDTTKLSDYTLNEDVREMYIKNGLLTKDDANADEPEDGDETQDEAAEPSKDGKKFNFKESWNNIKVKFTKLGPVVMGIIAGVLVILLIIIILLIRRARLRKKYLGYYRRQKKKRRGSRYYR